MANSPSADSGAERSLDGLLRISSPAKRETFNPIDADRMPLHEHRRFCWGEPVSPKRVSVEGKCWTPPDPKGVSGMSLYFSGMLICLTSRGTNNTARIRVLPLSLGFRDTRCKLMVSSSNVSPTFNFLLG